MFRALTVFFVILVFLGCSSDKNQNDDAVQNKTTVQNKIKKNSNTTNTKVKNKKAANKNKGKYFPNLKVALNLNDSQINKLKAISSKYNKKLKTIPKQKAQLIKETKAQKQQEIKKLLGEKLYLKKVAFDRKL